MSQIIVGLDPGGDTGYANYWTNSRNFEVQIITGEHHLTLETLLGLDNPDIIVCERFDYRPHQKNAELDSVEYIGVVKLYCQKNPDVKLVMQTQLKGKVGLWTDDKLKVLGLYNPGDGHDNDATRQVLYYLTTELNDTYWVERYKELADVAGE